MSFDKAFQIVLGHEGGYTDDPRDRGNWTSGIIGAGELKGTKYGIAAHAYPALDIKNLTLDQAKEIYRVDYWLKIKGDALPAAVAIAAFDCAVNQGVGRATRLLQRALGVQADGILGPRTLAAAASADSSDLLRKFMAERALAYVATGTLFETFGRGWMRRLFAVQEEALRETGLA
jgi:lysozyme family protein